MRDIMREAAGERAAPGDDATGGCGASVLPLAASTASHQAPLLRPLPAPLWAVQNEGAGEEARKWLERDSGSLGHDADSGGSSTSTGGGRWCLWVLAFRASSLAYWGTLHCFRTPSWGASLYRFCRPGNRHGTCA